MLLGIDIGGTTIHMGLVKGSVLVVEKTVPSFDRNWSQQQTLDYLCDNISRIFCPEVERIGVGVPTLVDPAKGIAYQAANIPSWDEVPIKDVLQTRFGVPVSVNNDSNCFALGAAACQEKAHNILVGITLGTGVGVGVIVNGKLCDGSHCGVGEIGALPYLEEDFEAYCSKKFFHSRGHSPRSAAEAAESGNPDAIALYKAFGEHLGMFLSVVMYAYDPDCVVLGGGITRSYALFQESMWNTLREKYPYTRALSSLCIQAMPEEEVALVGAASL